MTFRWLPLLFAAALVVGPAKPGAAQSQVFWQQPVDGPWTDAAAWTPHVVPQNDAPHLGDAYHAQLVAQEADHQVAIASDVTVSAITLASDNATLLLDGGRLTATNGVNLLHGKLLLRSGTLADTRLAGPAGVFTDYPGAVDGLTLENVTLATTLRSTGNSSFYRILLPTDLAFDGGAVEMGGYVNLHTIGDRQLVGNGRIVTRPDASSCCAPDGRIYIDGSDPSLEIDSGVAIRAEQGGWFMFDDWHEHTGAVSATNRGVIQADGAGSRVTVDQYIQFTNEGTLRATGGGRLEINSFKPGGTVGNLEIDPGSQVHLYSYFYDHNLKYGYRFDQPVTIPAGAQMSLTGWWNAAGTTMTVDGGTLRVRVNTPTTGNWVWQNGATISLDANVSATRLADFETSPTTHISFYNSSAYVALDSHPWNLNDIPGIWHLASSRFIQGTLTGLPNNNTIVAGDSVTLDDVHLAAPTTVAGGSLRLTDVSSIDAPLAITGGAFELRDNWTNNAGIAMSAGTLTLTQPSTSLGAINVSGGTLVLPSLPATPQQITMTGGVLEQSFAATIGQLRALPWSPEVVRVKGNVDLETGSLDPADDPWEWDLGAYNAVIRNGTLTDSTGGGWHFTSGVLRDVSIQADVEASQRVDFDGAILVDRSRLAGSWSVTTTAQVTLRGATIDGSLTLGGTHGSAAPVNVVDGLEVNGTLALGTRRLQFAEGQTIAGSGVATTAGGRGATGGGLEATGDLTLGADFTFHSQRNGSVLLAEGHALVNTGTIIGGVDSYGSRFLDVNAPSITLRAGSLAQHGRLEVAAGSRIEIDAPETVNNGTIALLGGTIELLGDLMNQPAAELAFEIGGTTAGKDYGQLAVDGELQLDGELTVSLASGFVPQYGQEFLIIDAASPLLGGFSQTTLPAMPAGLQWIVDQDALAVTLRVDYSPLATDYNDDGLITAADLQQWQLDFGTSAGSDHNGDGMADGADFLAWQRQHSAPSTAASTAVPEPSAHWLALVAIALGPRRRCAHRA